MNKFYRKRAACEHAVADIGWGPVGRSHPLPVSFGPNSRHTNRKPRKSKDFFLERAPRLIEGLNTILRWTYIFPSPWIKIVEFRLPCSVLHNRDSKSLSAKFFKLWLKAVKPLDGWQSASLWTLMFIVQAVWWCIILLNCNNDSKTKRIVSFPRFFFPSDCPWLQSKLDDSSRDYWWWYFPWSRKLV